jgi:hypothetical protein
MIDRYADIEFDDIEVDDTIYDYFITSGIWEYVKENIPFNEYELVIDLLENTLKQEIELNNSISSIVNTHLGTVVDIINRRFPNEKEMKGIIKSLTKSFKDLDWDKVPMLKQMKDVFKGKTVE